MMGPGIAATLALGGVRTILLSRSDEGAREGCRRRARRLVCWRRAGSHLRAGQPRARILLASHGVRRYDRSADLVIESAPEDMAFKQELFARMDGIARDRPCWPPTRPA